MSDDFNTQIELENGLAVPAWELVEQFVKSSGPGGQNVNKVSTAVELRWNVTASSLPEGAKQTIARRLANRISKEGDLVLLVGEHRSQAMNRAAARERLKGLLDTALKPRKKRVRTKPTYGSIQRRLKAKKVRGEVKSKRGKVEPGEE